jgi:hypothetical protein
MNKIFTRILNLILLVISIALLIGIIIKEIKYRSNERFNINTSYSLNHPLTGAWFYDCSIICDTTKVDIIDRENFFKIFINNRNSYKEVNTKTELNTIIPKEIKFKWFSFYDKVFYELNSKLPNYEIIDWLNKNKIDAVEFYFEFKKNGKVDLYIMEFLNNSKKMKINIDQNSVIKDLDIWIEDYKKDEMIDVINYNHLTKCLVNYENIKSNKNINLNVNTRTKFGRLSNYFKTNKNGKIDIYSGFEYGIPEYLRIEIIDSISLKHKNLNINFEIPIEQISSVIKNNFNTKFDLNVEIDKNDSLKKVSLKNSNKEIIMNITNIQYNNKLSN